MNLLFLLSILPHFSSPFLPLPLLFLPSLPSLPPLLSLPSLFPLQRDLLLGVEQWNCNVIYIPWIIYSFGEHVSTPYHSVRACLNWLLLFYLFIFFLCFFFCFFLFSFFSFFLIFLPNTPIKL